MTKTLVYQSFRTHNIPSWLTTCMTSVQNWAATQGYEYQFIDDSFFQVVPTWFADSVERQRHIMSDLARLEFADQYLNSGWDKVIWMDADLYIPHPSRFIIPNTSNFWLTAELWVDAENRQPSFSKRVNNAILVFNKENFFLKYYRDACIKIIKHKKAPMAHTEIGTKFLTGISHLLPQLKGVSLFSPFLLYSFYNKDQDLINSYLKKLESPIYAANMSLTFRDSTYENTKLDDSLYERIMELIKELPSF